MNVRELVTVLGFKLNDAPLKKYDQQIDSTKAKSNALAGAAKGIGSAYKWAAAAVGVGFAWISKNILDATAEMDGYRRQIETFTGSAEAAADTLAELRDKTIDPLFGTGNLVNAYKQLRTVGMSAEDTSRMIDVLGDVANGSAENFGSLTSILTRVSTSGKVNEMTLRQLTQAGFGVQDMAQSLGKSEAQLLAEIKAGKIGFDELTKAMSKATAEGGRFYQNAQKQARTLTGSIKILQDTVSSMGDAIGTAVLPKIVDTISYINDLIKLGREGFVNFGVKAFEGIIHAIQDVIIFFQVLGIRMKKFGGAFTPLKAIFSDVFGFLKSILQSATPFLLNLAQLILLVFKPIQAFVRPVLEALKPVFKDVFQFGADMIGALLPVIDSLTPVFKSLGEKVSQVIEKLRPVLKNIQNAIIAAFEPIKAFVTPIIEALWPVVEDVFNMITGALDDAEKGTSGLAGVVKSLTPAFEFVGNALAWFIGVLRPFVPLILGIVAAMKIWAVVQAVLNAVMAVNPITWIVIGIVAAITAIYALVKNWEKVKTALINGAQAIGNFFKKIWEGIKNAAIAAWNGLVTFFKKWGKTILQVLAAIIFGIPMLIVLAVRQIIKHWDVIGPKVKAVWEGIKRVVLAVCEAIKKAVLVVVDKIKAGWEAFLSFISRLWENIKAIAETVWNGIKAVFFAVIEAVKGGWQAFKDFISGLWEGIKTLAGSIWEGIKAVFLGVVSGITNAWQVFRDFLSGLWEGIKNLASSIWEGIKNTITGVVDSVKNIWNGLIGFFTGLWNALKEGPAEAVAFIRDSFFRLFDGIKEKFFGFINIIKEGWNTVKGFFGGIGEGIANFFTGGDKAGGGTQTRPVNDLIVTPEGQYSTSPDDYIMAMKNPASLLDALARFLQGPQLAYAGAGSGGGSLMGSAARSAAQQNTYNNSTTSNISSVTAPITVNVNASGMSPDQARAVVQRGVQDALTEAINGSRGNIPSPEARRN